MSNKNSKTITEYAYDPEGLRVVKRAKGETTHYVFEGTEPIFEKRISDSRIKSYVYALGKHLARVDGRIGDTGTKKYWYVTDHVGSIRAVTDKDGKKVWSADYLAFGKQFGEEKNADYPDFEELHSFTGKEYDPDTGLHYYNARWYDADLGRFISEDPVGDPNNPNLYSYGANNPLRFRDPSGLSLEDTWAEQDAADAENTSYFTESELADMGYTGGSDSSGETTGSSDPDSGDITQNTQKEPAQPVQGVDPNKKPEGDTKNIADDVEKKKTDQINNVVGKPKSPSEKTGNSKDNKHKPEVEDKSKKNSSWEERYREARQIKDGKSKKDAIGSLLEEKYPGFKYDPDKPLATQLDAWKNKDKQEIIGITIGFLGYNLNFQYNATIGKVDISKSFSPTSLIGFSFNYQIGKGGSIGTDIGLSNYFSVGTVWEFNDKGGANLNGLSVSVGVGISTPVNVNIDIPENCEPFIGL